MTIKRVYDDTEWCTKTKHDRVTLAKQWLEHAPRNAGPVADGLLGWQSKDMFMCAVCTGRLMGRGCHLDDVLPNAVACWDKLPKDCEGCDTCGRVM